MRLIAVEANIGAGKSTLLPKLAEKLGFKQIQEPVDDPVFLELLEDFTTNPHNTEKRLKFQQYITERRAKLLEGIPDGDYLIERSLFSDLVFSQVNMLGMERPSGEYLAYYYDIIDRLKDYPHVDAVIYLRTSPEVAYRRMLSRGREAENGTPLEYLEDLSRYHDASLPQTCRAYNTKLLTFGWDDFGESEGGLDAVVHRLREAGVV